MIKLNLHIARIRLIWMSEPLWYLLISCQMQEGTDSTQLMRINEKWIVKRWGITSTHKRRIGSLNPSICKDKRNRHK
jgi:hypothetical protein